VEIVARDRKCFGLYDHLLHWRQLRITTARLHVDTDKAAKYAWKGIAMHGDNVEIIAVSEIYKVCVSLECGAKRQIIVPLL
jgi:uncharacterized protein YegP (UPF0339 family)